MPKEATDLAVRKKMRKGTHSCFECRRRKIRCIFPNDNPDVCSECFARGSRCIDQEHASPDVIVDHRKNLRERVSRLEALVDSLLDDKTEKSESVTSKTPNIVTRDTFPPTPLSSDASSAIIYAQRAQSDRGAQGHHVPLISAFEDALNDAKEREERRMGGPGKASVVPAPEAVAERFTITCHNAEDVMDDMSSLQNAKRARVKEALLALLPPTAQLNHILASNNNWWQTWRQKCSGTSAGLNLPQFAARALQDDNIGAIGTVVLSVSICSDENDVDRYIETIDRWVLSDDEYAATLEGMELLILKAKWYADVGQPRRAWLAYRKGLMYTQLMGLHRKRTSSMAHESIWWALYHGDRFLSLLLGLPYGVSDAHCDLSLPDMGGKYLPPLLFMNKIGILAGKVIDRNQGIAEQSFAFALQLDQELEDLWKKLDPEWLEFADLLVDIESNAAELRERIMAQMVYHQLRVYLHLPFMLKSQSNPRFTFSRTACLSGSREVLRLYHAIRTGEVQPLYECKAIDFIGFTAAVLIMLGLFNYGAHVGTLSPKQQEEDIRLIEISIDIFQRASSEKGGKVAFQSAEVLDKMLKKFRTDWIGDDSNEHKCGDDLTDFVIPYFGTISIKRGGKQAQPPVPPAVAQRMKTNSLTTVRSNSASNPSPSTSQFTPTSEKTSSDLFGNPSFGASSATSLSQGQPENAFPFSNTNTGITTTASNPFVSYDGFYNWPNMAPADRPSKDPANPATSTPSTTLNHADASPHLDTQLNDDSMTNFPLPTNNFSWQNMPMDIDQDWSWFLNSDQMGGSSTGAATVTGQNAGSTTGTGGNLFGLGSDFGQQAFTGF